MITTSTRKSSEEALEGLTYEIADIKNGGVLGECVTHEEAKVTVKGLIDSGYEPSWLLVTVFDEDGRLVTEMRANGNFHQPDNETGLRFFREYIRVLKNVFPGPFPTT